MNFDDWFDIENKDHLYAFQVYCMDHSFPYGFIPAGIIFNRNWLDCLLFKIARKFLREKLNNDLS